MNVQLAINEHGELTPLTWDHEPLLSPSTVREMTAGQLFDVVAFQQLDGQLALEDDGDE